MFPEQETVEEGGTLLEHKKIFDVKFYSYILEYINIYYWICTVDLAKFLSFS